jgi:hypothetical protein
VLGREYLLAGHLIDRAGMPQIIGRSGREAMQAVAIEEWMGASPVYTRRVQRALGFAGDDVGTIFKGMQLDIGAPHRFMDFRFRVSDPLHGEFWLASCGALMDVEPMGEDFVVGMCHHIEDPTFDATACATNPRARMRPLHRPPREPADRHPHCHWVVEIDPSASPVPEPPAALRVAASRAAGVEIARPAAEGTEPGGRDAYDGAFDPAFSLDDLSWPTLVVALDEVCLQGHLLAHSFLWAVEHAVDGGFAREATGRQCVGIAGLVASRLARMLGLEVAGSARRGAGALDRIARVLDLHPLFRPRVYVDLRVAPSDEHLSVAVGPCEALAEDGRRSWHGLLADPDPPPVMEALVQGVDPRARVRRVDPPGDAVLAWEITHDPGADPLPEPPEVTLTHFSTGAAFDLERG